MKHLATRFCNAIYDNYFIFARGECLSSRLFCLSYLLFFIPILIHGILYFDNLIPLKLTFNLRKTLDSPIKLSL